MENNYRFFCITDLEFPQVLGANSVYARLDDLAAKFNILSENKYIERLAPGNGMRDITNEAYWRNYYKYKFCDLDDLPSHDEDT